MRDKSDRSDRDKDKGKGGGISFAVSDQTVGEGFFGPGPAEAKEHRFGIFDYQGKQKPQTALLVTFDRDGEEHIEAMTVGQGWKPSKDGLTILPQAGQKGLNSSCKAALYIKALADDCGMPEDFIPADDISVLDGIVGDVIRKPMEINRSKDKDKKKGFGDRVPTVLLFESVESAPWDEKGGKSKPKAKAKGKAADADDDDDDDADDDTPATRRSAKKGDDDDEDDDAPVAKGKAGKAGKSKSDDDDDDVDEDDLEQGVEALISALDDGALKLANVGEAVLGALKKNPNRKRIAALMSTPRVLEMEKGWSFNGKVVKAE